MTAFVSVTRLRLRHWRFLPGFALHVLRARNQARRAEGFRGGSVLADRRLTFWTLTRWDSSDAMRGYMLSGHHRAAMPWLAQRCDEASVVHWDDGDDALPSWDEADRRMRSEGRPSKLHHPSASHAALDYLTPRLSVTAPLVPCAP